jgi:hypothetical protein
MTAQTAAIIGAAGCLVGVLGLVVAWLAWIKAKRVREGQ